jgi:arsenite-transporting ATPase
MSRRHAQALDHIPSELAKLPQTQIRLAPHGMLGVASLRGLLSGEARQPAARVVPDAPSLAGLSTLLDELVADGHGVILTMGKGGVGKTTVAAALAVALADRGFAVHLSTTDPAAHLAETLAGEHNSLRVSRIDPLAESAAYSAEVMETAGAHLDGAGKALLAEDLRSPCTEEIAVFRAFARAVDGGASGFVVLDTAPTGHTILLLDAALAYHREVTRQASGMPPEVEKLLPRLRDPHFTRVLIVTLPEATPVHEAAKLQLDLERAGIQPFAWVINQSLTPLDVRDPVLHARQRDEQAYIREVIDEHAVRAVLVPWQAEPPVGREGLRHVITPLDMQTA